MVASLCTADFILTVRHLGTGGWFISELLWRDIVISRAGTDHFAAGWELNLDGHRHTPHSADIIPLPVVATGNPESRAFVLPHRTADGRARIDHHLRLHHGALESWIEITNDSPAPLAVTRVNFGQLKLDPSFLTGLELRRDYARTPAPCLEHHLDLHDPVVLLARPDRDCGLALINLAPAQTRRIATGTYTSLGYSNGTAPFAWRLAAGETFVSDRAVFLPYSGDPRPALHACVRSRIRAGRPTPLPLTYCSWEPFFRDIDEPRLLQQIDLAADLGFETFVIDDGWQLHAGDWEPDPVKFPRGLAPLRDHLASRGLHLGLWVGLATLHPASRAYAQFQNGLVRDAAGRPRETHVAEGSLVMGCLAGPYAAHIAQKLHHLVASLDLRYLKLDLPVPFDVYNQPAVLCHATDHEHAPGHDYTLRSYRAIQRIARDLQAAFPRLVLDLTFELWGGWHAIDPALLACADVCWLSNLDDAAGSGHYGPAQARHLAASRSTVIPSEHLVIGNLRCNGPHPAESVASAFAGHPVLLGDLRALSDPDRATLRSLFFWFRRLRDRHTLTGHQTPLLESGQSHESLHRWSGFLRTDAQGCGLLGIFRNLSGSSEAVLPVFLPVSDDTPVSLSPALGGPSVSVTAGALRAGHRFHLPAHHGFALYHLLTGPFSEPAASTNPA
jgi:hypothetical protein